MSVKASNWAWDVPDLTTAQRVVLLKLADAADPQRFECWPSVPFLADKACLSQRQTERVLSQLAELKLIKRRAWNGRDGRRRRRKNESIYLYTLAVKEARDPDKLSPRQIVEDDIRVEPTPTFATSDPDIRVEPTPTSSRARGDRKKPLHEPTTEPTTETGAPDGAVPADAGEPAKAERIDYQRYVREWNHLAAIWQLPRVEVFGEARREKLRVRLRELGFNWPALLRKVQALCEAARDGQTVWLLEKGLLDFDFLTKNQRGYARLLEGSYDPRPAEGAREKPPSEAALNVAAAQRFARGEE